LELYKSIGQKKNFKEFLIEHIGKEIVEKRLSPESLLRLGY